MYNVFSVCENGKYLFAVTVPKIFHLREAADQYALRAQPGRLHLLVYEEIDELGGALDAGLVLLAVRVEGEEVEPGGHLEAGVQGDGHLGGGGANHLHVRGPARSKQFHLCDRRGFKTILYFVPDIGDGGGPAVAGVPESVEEDDGGGVLAAGGHDHGVRHGVEQGRGGGGAGGGLVAGLGALPAHTPAAQARSSPPGCCGLQQGRFHAMFTFVSFS